MMNPNFAISSNPNSGDEALTQLFSIYEDYRLGLVDPQQSKAQFNTIYDKLSSQALPISQKRLLDEVKQQMQFTSPVRRAGAPLSTTSSRLPIRFNSNQLPPHIKALYPQKDLIHGVSLQHQNFRLDIIMHRWFKHRTSSSGGFWSSSSLVELREEVAGTCWKYDQNGQLISSQSWSTATLFPEVFQRRDFPHPELASRFYIGPDGCYGFEGYYLPEMGQHYKRVFFDALRLLPMNKTGTSPEEAIAKIPELNFPDSGLLNSEFYAPDSASQLFGKIENPEKAIENALFNTMPMPFGPLTVNSPYFKVIAPTPDAAEVTVFLLGAYRKAEIGWINGVMNLRNFDRHGQWYCKTIRTTD